MILAVSNLVSVRCDAAGCCALSVETCPPGERDAMTAQGQAIATIKRRGWSLGAFDLCPEHANVPAVAAKGGAR